LNSNLEHLRTSDNVRIAVHKLGAPVKARVLLVPGTFSNHTFWFGTRGVGFALELGAAGYEAWALDPRGHGASERPRAGDDWDIDDWARHDVPAALRAAAADGPVFLIGHSAGGAAALAGLGAEPGLRALVRGLVIVATPMPWLQGYRKFYSRFARSLSLALGYFPARLLRLGPEDELPGVMTQWMGWNLNSHWIGDDGTDYSARLADIAIPLLMIAGIGDRIFAPPSSCRSLFDRLASTDRTFLLCGKETGYSEDFTHPGILTSRAARAEVWPKMLGWLDAH
jgi:pimeloyl-ACP methyl ester carboxylesterase